MRIRRYWLDADGRPHVEVATWLGVPEGDERGRRIDFDMLGETEGSHIIGPAIATSVSAPAVDPAALASDPSRIYELPLAEGVVIIDRVAWQVATEEQATADAEALADVDAILAQRNAEAIAARAEVLAKVAAATGLTDAELAILTGGA